MARLVVRRDGAWFGYYRAVRVEVDGREVMRVARGRAQMIELPAGPHRLVTSMDWVRSVPHEVELSDHEETHVAVAAPFWRSLLATFTAGLVKTFRLTISREPFDAA